MAERLESDEPGVRHAALWALTKIPADERQQQAAVMRQKLEHTDAGVRYHALQALGMLAPDDRQRHAAAMAKLLDDPDAQVCAHAAIPLRHRSAGLAPAPPRPLSWSYGKLTYTLHALTGPRRSVVEPR